MLRYTRMLDLQISIFEDQRFLYCILKNFGSISAILTTTYIWHLSINLIMSVTEMLTFF